jgi:hypothetical protein
MVTMVGLSERGCVLYSTLFGIEISAIPYAVQGFVPLFCGQNFASVWAPTKPPVLQGSNAGTDVITCFAMNCRLREESLSLG